MVVCGNTNKKPNFEGPVKKYVIAVKLILAI